MKTRRAFFALLTCIVFAGPLAAEDTVWPTISRENKPWTRWWWLGSAVDKPNLTRELEALADAAPAQHPRIAGPAHLLARDLRLVCAAGAPSAAPWAPADTTGPSWSPANPNPPSS